MLFLVLNITQSALLLRAFCLDSDAFFFLEGAQPEALLFQAQLVQLVCSQSCLPYTLMLDQSGGKRFIVDILRVAMFEAYIVVIDRPKMAPPQ